MEYKFKAYIKSIGQMVQVLSIDFENEIIKHEAIDYDMKMDKEIPMRNTSSFKDCNLMIYANHKDINDKEIYEGDIVELTNTYKGMNTKSIVEIDFIDFTFAGKWAEEYSPSGYMYNPLGSYNFPIVTIEVIGNIYENPELLGEHRKGDS